jgi:hypothetical protein
MAEFLRARIVPDGVVHLAHVDGSPICGARGTRRKAYITTDPATCQRCLDFGPDPERLYAVRATYADNPAADTAEHLTAPEIAGRWPWLTGVLTTSKGMVSVAILFEDLSRIRIDEDTPRPGDLGYDAGYSRVPRFYNPFAPKTPEHGEWDRGYTSGLNDARRLKSIGLY